MADLVMGAMPNLIPKLYELLEKEYNLQTGVKERIRFLTHELELAQTALRKVAQVPWDQLDEQVQLWARQVREASYDMEDVLDTFLVRVKRPESAEEEQHSLLKLLKKMIDFFKKSKERRKISGDVMDIMTHLQEVTERCRRYKVYDIVPTQAMTSTLDPRLAAMYTKVNKLVGMDKSCGELMSMLQNPQRGDASDMKMKIVSIVGVGGLGKTTLAKAVYDRLEGDFDCTAFVPVGRNPDLKKIFKDILIDFDKQSYLHLSTASLDERQLIDELRSFLLKTKKRYLIIIDDIWDVESWEIIKSAIDDDNNYGGTIIMTTRNLVVARQAHKVYKLQPLPYDSSRELFITRISGQEGKYVHNQPDEISDKFIRKCSGIPLAIITMASLLAGKQRVEWPELYNTIDFGSKDNKQAENTMRILSFSYYDLPSHLRACLLYLSAFPEDSAINKDSLVWKWVAEGFVQENEGKSLFEIGEGYFNNLINRSMIQAVESEDDDGIIIGCRVHDVVLDFIRSMSREENFFTILDNDQGRLLQQSIVRRLTKHNRTIGNTHQTTNHFGMPKLRSFIALECIIETWAPLSSFKLLRVLAIENCKPRDGYLVRVEDLIHLVHLRYLSLSGTQTDSIPEEIGALRFLQTLDLSGSRIPELPSSCSLLKRLACLRITLIGDALDGKVFSVEGMTSLEELEIDVWGCEATRRLVEELGNLRGLRVLSAGIRDDKETERDLVESLRHLHKLQSLNIYRNDFSDDDSIWQATELVLSCHLRHLSLSSIEFCKLPSCINPGCLPNLSHMDLWLQDADEQDLKTLGGLLNLRFLSLNLSSSSSATIHNISDSDACYFPKLRRFSLTDSMIVFVVANEGDRESVSFHIWNGEDDIGIMHFVSDDDELESDDDELQGPIRPTVSDDDELHIPLRRCSKLQKLGQHPSISNRGSAPSLNGEDPIVAMPSVSGDENKGTICSKDRAATCFMPNLQVLELIFTGPAKEGHPYMDNFGWEYLSSLQEIKVPYALEGYFKVEAVLRRSAQVHPNRPTLRIKP